MNKTCFLLHAYSPKNSGDGLLVELSIELINQSRDYAKIYVVCLDKQGFIGKNYGYENVEFVSVLELALKTPRLLRDKTSFDIYGVGGGYLRAPDFKVGLKTFLAHGSQMVWKKFFSTKKIYFPQSVGPFTSFWLPVFSWLLKDNNVVFLRDNKSIQELDGLENTLRTPDLVANKIIKKFCGSDFSRNQKENIYFVFRDIPAEKGRSSYLHKISELIKRFPDSKLALQSVGRGNSDDNFYADYFKEYSKEIVPMAKVLMDPKALVVSVRLHGSLEAILSNVPSIHIAYERKGFAAYEDLGIKEYCHHVSSFDVDIVASQIESLLNNIEPYSLLLEHACRKGKNVDINMNISKVLA